MGANLLTHLVGQNVNDLAAKLSMYRDARKECGHPGDGRVTLMLHTFVGGDLDGVRETVREPFSNYLRTSVDLLKHSPWGFAPARLSADVQLTRHSAAPAELTEEALTVLVDQAFNGYFDNSSLFGTPDICLQMVDRLRAIGVDEIACLIDFGVESRTVLDALPLLDHVRERSNKEFTAAVSDFGLAALAREYNVTHFQCTPSMAEMLISHSEHREWLGRLRKLIVGGEALPTTLAASLKQSVAGTIHNMYGPTETTVWSTTDIVDDTAVSIGRPIANTEVRLLDPQCQLVPAGVAGELCIGGAGVARGYFNRPELTSDRFIRDPFNVDSEARLYRTGDLARYRKDGKLEFLGRMDHQVKLRGHRIELAEIETVLGHHPAVRQSVAVSREDVPGAKRLVAYVVLLPDTSRNPDELRTYLEAQLPSYMVPSTFVFLDNLPHTPNGKLDRRALPPPDGKQAGTVVRFVAPRTPVEEILAGIWGELLGVESVGAQDNFFALGGHSLLAAQLIARLREVFGVELPLGIMFEGPTIAELAAFMIQHEPKPGVMEKTALTLKSIEDLSESEIEARLHTREVS